MLVNLLLEGWLEEPVADKLLEFCGHTKGTVYGKKGCAYIHAKTAGFYSIANHDSALLVLSDFMDTSLPCPPEALQQILPQVASLSHYFLCRFAVNELESWLMADRRGMADFLDVPLARIPMNPDDEPNPKQSLVVLARSSRRKAIREGIPPPVGHKGPTSPQYLAAMTDFILKHWRVEEAMLRSPSLRRCVERLQQLNP